MHEIRMTVTCQYLVLWDQISLNVHENALFDINMKYG